MTESSRTSWFREESERAKKRNTLIPPHARMIVTNPILSAHTRTTAPKKSAQQGGEMNQQSGGVVLTEEDGPECETCGKQTCPDAQLPAFSEPVNCEFEPIYQAIRDSKDCDYGCSRDYTNQAICLWIAPEIESIVAARLAAQAGRVAEVVEKVLREAGLKPLITAALAAQVAAELEADHGAD